jgi:hypothetical protein
MPPPFKHILENGFLVCAVEQLLIKRFSWSPPGFALGPISRISLAAIPTLIAKKTARPGGRFRQSASISQLGLSCK